MSHVLVSSFCAVGLFLGMCLASIAMHRLARRRSDDARGAPEMRSAVTASVFALLGLLIAFTFAGAHSRFETRRQLIVDEVNAIGTAWLRLDLLPPEGREPLRELFRAYLASRAAIFPQLGDPAAARAEQARATALQAEIWSRAIEATRGEAQGQARLLLLPALNAMIDIATTRAVAIRTHPHFLVFAMLFLLALACAGLTGYLAASNPALEWTHLLGFAAVTAVVVYVILDIEYPRDGLVSLEAVNQLFDALSASWR
ncbi:MAG TPA: DUF4239 domain-containing protein [Planctomycetota bacterium]|nr:DUF4239 domain-containing protein [Planctomycetota bacterium]